MSYLAYVSNVSFVFEDYTWSHTPLPWTIHGFALRPARIPLNAIISGPTAGGPMSHSSQAPLAVSADFYERTCGGPEAKPYVLSSASAPNDEDGTTIIEWWTQQLVSVQERCIEIDSTPHDSNTHGRKAFSAGLEFYPSGNHSHLRRFFLNSLGPQSSSPQ